MDPTFQWPIPPVNVNAGQNDKRFMTKEKQRDEVVRRRQLWKDCASKKKQITKELRL